MMMGQVQRCVLPAWAGLVVHGGTRMTSPIPMIEAQRA